MSWPFWVFAGCMVLCVLMWCVLHMTDGDDD